MRLRAVLTLALIAMLAVPAQALAAPARERHFSRNEGGLPKGFVPAVVRMHDSGRYFVQMKAPSLVSVGGARMSSVAQRAETADVMRSQQSAIGAVEAAGGTIVFRYARLVNAFSAQMTGDAAAAIARRPDVKLVEPVPVVRALNSTSVPFIGATKVWHKLHVRGQGMTVALVDTGIDYTHADFNGPGTVAAYDANDPTVIEPGSFPTSKVIGGYDFTGGNYDVLDDDPTNDIPVPDPDPLDDAIHGAHGTHTAGTCCGVGVPGIVGAGVAPKAKLLAVKVWDSGNSTADVLVEGYEFSLDPNGDGSMKDAADVLSFSGGVDYGPPSSVEAQAAQAVVKAGTVFVASAGNSGNQPNGGSGYILGTPASAPGVIAVAASIDQFVAQQITVNAPSGVTLPGDGPIVAQDWAAPITADVIGDVVDAREFSPPADPSGDPAPADRELCDSTPAGSPFDGKIVLVFKGPFGGGDCLADDKVLHAQEAGAIAVILWDGFGGLPGQYSPGTSAASITIPAVSLGGEDSAALAAAISPDAPTSFNTVTVNVTLGATGAVIPGFEDRMTDFTSEGPARISSELKPDISAPGSDVTSAAAGTGDAGVTFSGTSMAAPHVSGVATLLRQLHPTWTPAKIKAVLMNQATQDVANLDGSGPVPATVIGSGRVEAYESARTTNLATPGSLSYGLQGVTDLTTMVKTITLRNQDDRTHRYEVSGSVRYTDYRPNFASVRVAVNDEQLATSHRFTLKAGRSAKVFVEVTLDPGRVPAWQQEYGWYYFNPNVDGNVSFTQLGAGGDEFHVPWHVSALASADTGVGANSLDLGVGSAELPITELGLGRSYADLYLLGASDPVDDGSEADITAIGARSFVGSSIDGVADGLPEGTDGLAGITWLQFLTNGDEPTEPVQFVVAGNAIRNTTETLEIDILVDVKADGLFADQTLEADVLLVETAGSVCVFQLPSDFSACDATYFPDYSNYNANVVGVPVDVSVLGLKNQNPTLSYGVVSCTGVFSGDVPAFMCDSAGDIDPATGTYSATLNVTDPALVFSSAVCLGFWGGSCGPETVSVGSAAAGDDPSILAVFPNNAPGNQTAIVTTGT